MGCFSACFIVPERRKVRRSAVYYRNYKPLRSFNAKSLENKENLIHEDSKFRDEPNEYPRCKTRKKVSFNLNVESYEPIPEDCHFSEIDKEVKHDKDNGGTGYKGGCTSLKLGCYPINYRYQNCRDSYDEADDLACKESDLECDDSEDDDDVNDEYDCDNETDDQTMCGKGVSGKIQHSVLEPVKDLTQWRLAKAKTAAGEKRD